MRSIHFIYIAYSTNNTIIVGHVATTMTLWNEVSLATTIKKLNQIWKWVICSRLDFQNWSKFRKHFNWWPHSLTSVQLEFSSILLTSRSGTDGEVTNLRVYSKSEYTVLAQCMSKRQKREIKRKNRRVMMRWLEGWR